MMSLRSMLQTVLVLLVLGTAACSGGGGAPSAPTPPATPGPTPQAPPFTGTIFIDADIITAEDPTTFASLIPNGQGLRTMYDRRVAAFIQLQAYLFNVTFSDGLSTEVQVNPEFGSVDAARVQAEKYAIVIGRLPRALRVSVATVWIHQGVQPFGGGNNNLLIHVGQGDIYIADGILEETFVHEAAHTSLDAAHAASAGWLSAQAKDVNFISTYARARMWPRVCCRGWPCATVRAGSPRRWPPPSGSSFPTASRISTRSAS
jgi:hypothetical protein